MLLLLLYNELAISMENLFRHRCDHTNPRFCIYIYVTFIISLPRGHLGLTDTTTTATTTSTTDYAAIVLVMCKKSTLIYGIDR